MVFLAKDTAQQRTRIHQAHPAPGVLGSIWWS